MWTVILMMIFATGIAKTGLIDRIAYNIIKFFPATYTGMVVAIMATSTILSPIVPNSYSKCAVLGPFAASVAKANNIKREAGLPQDCSVHSLFRPPSILWPF